MNNIAELSPITSTRCRGMWKNKSFDHKVGQICGRPATDVLELPFGEKPYQMPVCKYHQRAARKEFSLLFKPKPTRRRKKKEPPSGWLFTELENSANAPLS